MEDFGNDFVFLLITRRVVLSFRPVRDPSKVAWNFRFIKDFVSQLCGSGLTPTEERRETEFSNTSPRPGS